MKLICLNIWGGRAGRDGLLSFFDRHKNDVDIFCLQEIWSAPYENYENHVAGGIPIKHGQIMTNAMQDISGLLSGYNKYFRPHFMDNYGLMMLAKESTNIISEGELFVYKEKGYIPDGDIGGHARNIQYVMVMLNQKPITIINFHGLWNGQGKTDTADRLNQSKNILKFIKTLNGECILCGDFNLLPDTESIKLFESAGLKNLVKENKITSTRSNLYTKPEKFADYIFTSEKIKVNSFKVLPDEVSDHLALFLDFE